jgi:antirestriction protein ArdC
VRPASLSAEEEHLTPEEAAAQLLDAVGGGGLPVDPRAIAEEHDGLDVQEHANPWELTEVNPRDVTGEVSGLLVPAMRRIIVNATEAARSPARVRFTIAHELGHWHLHRRSGRAQTRFCREDQVGGTRAELQSSKRIEAEANRFAAELLMPRELVRAEAERARLSVPALAKRFGVSAAAMQVRLEVLELLPAYMRTR